MANWQPTISKDVWLSRMDLIHKIRSFFVQRQVLEVETPLLSQAMGTDPHLDYFETRDFIDGSKSSGKEFFLMTSPEFHMKRLLAAGFGDIWQFCKAFRCGESGHRHNPEFTMLEWYRVHWDWHQLMQEVQDLVQSIAQTRSTPAALLIQQAWKKITWQEAYIHFVGINPLEASVSDFAQKAIELNLPQLPDSSSLSNWQDYFMTSLIEPQLGFDAPTYLTHYPATQAALAQLDSTDPRFAKRFELYIHGIELCNGYQELIHAEEQKKRFVLDLQERKDLHKRLPPIDSLFLQALEAGMPPCSGVALGVDRLVMLLLDKENLEDVLLFPSQRC